MARLSNKAFDSLNQHFRSSQESDYGGDFTFEEESQLNSLLSQYNSQYSATPPVNVPGPSNELSAGAKSTPADSGGVALHSLPRSFASVETLEELVQSGAFPAEVHFSTPKDPSSSQTVAPALEEQGTPEVETSKVNNRVRDQNLSAPAAGNDNTSPLGKFRARKPLSVTDLVSPAWCELQYSFSLHHHGRKRRTAAMKQGSVAHRKLEDEVHATFSVEVMTKEDAWGLRLWNVIQGARTLRETGMTRELEVWGMLDGQLVNGVIDELNYECPDPELELEGLRSETQPDGRREGGQKSIEAFLESQNAMHNSTEGTTSSTAPNLSGQLKVYLTDHKTRTIRSVPRGSAFKPTAMQLMIYRKLLSSLASEQSLLDPVLLWERYGVDPDARFSDYFVKQFGDTPVPSQTSAAEPNDDVASLADTMKTSSTSLQASEQSGHSFQTQTTEPSAMTVSLDDLNVILRHHPTPRELWSRMLAELRRAIPSGLGNVLRVEYWDQAESDQLGTKNFLYDEKTLATYLGQTMQWWKGERGACGVDISDAWKCKGCEFADICDWRKDKVDEAVKRFRQKSKK